MRILCLLMLCFTTLNSRAQNAEADVNIGVVCPEKMDNLSEAGLARLRHKIEQIGTANGVSSFLDGVFVMYPTLDIVDMQTVEGGMKNLFVIKAEMQLTVMQMSSKALINSVSTTLTGRGYSVPEALMNAISGIDVRDSLYHQFLSNSKKRIFTYYESNSSKLINAARVLAAQQQYEAALVKLAFFPESLPSYPKVCQAIIEIYKQFQAVQCSRMIQKAKGYIALKDYRSAIDILAQVDPESQCKTECVNLLNTIKQQVDKEDSEAIDRELKIFNTLVGLEKHRLSAVRDAVKAYYSSQPAIHYTQIIK